MNLSSEWKEDGDRCPEAEGMGSCEPFDVDAGTRTQSSAGAAVC